MKQVIQTIKNNFETAIILLIGIIMIIILPRIRAANI